MEELSACSRSLHGMTEETHPPSLIGRPMSPGQCTGAGYRGQSKPPGSHGSLSVAGIYEQAKPSCLSPASPLLELFTEDKRGNKMCVSFILPGLSLHTCFLMHVHSVLSNHETLLAWRSIELGIQRN